MYFLFMHLLLLHVILLVEYILYFECIFLFMNFATTRVEPSCSNTVASPLKTAKQNHAANDAKNKVTGHGSRIVHGTTMTKWQKSKGFTDYYLGPA